MSRMNSQSPALNRQKVCQFCMNDETLACYICQWSRTRLFPTMFENPEHDFMTKQRVEQMRLREPR